MILQRKCLVKCNIIIVGYYSDHDTCGLSMIVKYIKILDYL